MVTDLGADPVAGSSTKVCRPTPQTASAECLDGIRTRASVSPKGARDPRPLDDETEGMYRRRNGSLCAATKVGSRRGRLAVEYRRRLWTSPTRES